MQYIFTKLKIDMVSGEILEKEGFWYDGPVDRACGASDEQHQVFNEQNTAAQQLTNQAQSIFGSSSQIFKDLTSAFEPVLAAGPDQSGYSAAELSNLKSQAITQTGQQYKNAAQAAGERTAAAGGGNAILPSGAAVAQQAQIAQAGAGQTASELSNINLQNQQLGRQNWLQAASVLGGAPGVFNPATSAGSAATVALEGASSTANQITQANNSWMTPVAGILGGVAGGLTGGLLGGGAAGAGGGALSGALPVGIGQLSPGQTDQLYGGSGAAPILSSPLPNQI